MESIKNEKVIQECRSVLGKEFEGKIPELDISKIILVSDVNPKPMRRVTSIKIGTTSDALSSTVFTSSATKKTYIHYIDLSLAKDINSTSLYTQVVGKIFGEGYIGFLIIRTEPLTAGTFNKTIYFNNPILIEKGTNVTLTHSTNVASIDASAIIGISEEDD